MNDENYTDEDAALDREIERRREARDFPTSADPYYTARLGAPTVPGADNATRPEGARHE